MIPNKQDYVTDNLLPFLKPLFDFFGTFGVVSSTVVGIPAVVLIFLTINRRKLDSYDSITKLVSISLILFMILQDQF